MSEEQVQNEQKHVQLIVEKNMRTYRFIVPVGAPLGETYDASIDISRQLLKIAEKSLPLEE